MKFLEKISLVIFSIVMIVISVVNCLLVFGWLYLGTINTFANRILNNSTYSNILLGISVVFILLAIKCIFFGSSSKDSVKSGNGVLLENDNGKLVVSRETLVNIVNSVAKGFESTENVTTRVVLDKESNLRVFVELFVRPNAVIKDLSVNLQNRIKEAIKKTADLEVKEVNIKIRNIASEDKQELK